jgi:Na+/H+ antiporter NhaB
MVVMALPYTITMSITGLLALWYLSGWVPGPHGG